MESYLVDWVSRFIWPVDFSLGGSFSAPNPLFMWRGVVLWCVVLGDCIIWILV